MHLLPFQRRDVDNIKNNGLRALVANDPGTGKTIIAIAVVNEAGRDAQPAVVICPSAVVINWGIEFQKWAPNLKVVTVEDMTTPIPVHSRAVYILSWALLDARWEELSGLGIRGVVADEAHFAKNPEALRSVALRGLAHDAKTRLLLTGTPIVNTEAEMTVLTEYLGPNPVLIRRLFEDVQDHVPAKVRNSIPILLRENHREVYDKADQDFTEWLEQERSDLEDEGLPTKSLAAAALLRIGILRRMVGEFKVPAAVDFVCRAVRMGEPVVVLMEHQRVLAKLQRGLTRNKVRYVTLDGNTPPRERQSVVEQFQRGEIPVFLGTKAAKEGITLTAAKHTLFLERYYTSAEEDQGEGRTYRLGQTEKTTMWRLHAVDTIDDRLDEIVLHKRHVIREAIVSADIAETDLSNTEAILNDWGKTVAPKTKPWSLGHGPPLEPLPDFSKTHAIVFTGWSTRKSERWCTMHGLPKTSVVVYEDRHKRVVRPSVLFNKASFRSIKVSKHIKFLVGEKVSRRNEALLKRIRSRR